MTDNITKKSTGPWYKKILFVFFVVGIIAVLIDVVTSPKLVQSANGKVNVLVMGKSGGSNTSPDLTDTMILASVSLNKPYVTLVSIPRDLWIPEIRAKINSAYFWGKTGSQYVESQKVGGGIGLAKKIVGEVVGQPIQYGIVLDFSSFKDVIDAIGGVWVDVAQGFTDKFYPIEGRENDLCDGDKTYTCRYETVTFNPGVQFMNGETALKFVRSRRAEGSEGTDIAREARQQKVINAIKAKITKPATFLSLKADITIIKIARKYIETDIGIKNAASLAKYVAFGWKNVTQFLIPEDLLVHPPIGKTYDNQYVFIPKVGNGNWNEVKNWFSLTFSD